MNTTFNKGDMAEFAKYSVEHFKATGSETITNASVDYWSEWKDICHRHKDFVLELRRNEHDFTLSFKGMEGRTALEAVIDAHQTPCAFNYKCFHIGDISNWECRFGENGDSLANWNPIERYVDYGKKLLKKGYEDNQQGIVCSTL